MSAELSNCPLCQFPTRPHVTRGGHSGKFFLHSPTGCEHVWKVVNYQQPAATEEEAATRWNAWVQTQTPPQAAEPAKP
jgi:hypothetical protein